MAFNSIAIEKIKISWQSWLKQFKGLRVALYGAGEHTEMLESCLGEAFYQMPITCIIDQSPQCQTLLGYPVISRQNFDFTTVDFIIISSCSAEQEIFDSLNNSFPLNNIGRLYNFSRQQIFKNIHDDNHWGADDSVSGPGSTEQQTKKIIKKLPQIFSELKITNMLDIPCGDFNWMEKVINENIEYYGGDIVEDLITRNNNLYQSNSVTFTKLDILFSDLPKVDILLCRDCLVHFSYSDICKALANVIRSGASYFITTTFTERTSNDNINTGGWRPLNLCVAPFNFPPPFKLIVEECTENGGIYQDKALAVWKIEDITPLFCGEKR